MLKKQHTDKRVSQATLDYWRDSGGETGKQLILVARHKNTTIGASFCSIKNGKVENSSTIVIEEFRKRLLGYHLLKLKLEVLKNDFENPSIVFNVSSNNEPGIRLCQKTDSLKKSEEKTRIINGDERKYFQFTN